MLVNPKNLKAMNISIDGVNYPLTYNSNASHNTSYPLLMVGSYPLISIKHDCGIPCAIEVERAKIAIDSFQLSERKYAFMMDFGIAGATSSTLVIDNLDPSKIKADHYHMQLEHFVVVESRIKDENWFKFSVFDQAMGERILKMLGKEYSYSYLSGDGRNYYNLPEIGDTKMKASLALSGAN
jgi:hypothetical protein